MRAIAALIFLSVFSRLGAQTNVDSLRHLIRQAIINNKTEFLSSHYAQLAYHYNLHGVYDSAIRYYRYAVREGNGSQDPVLMASSLNEIAIAYGYLGRSDSSILYYNRALRAYSELNDTLHVAVIESNLAIAYKNLTLYDKALNFSFRAISHHEQLGELQSLAATYNTVSLVYLKVHDYAQALDFARKSLSIRKKIGHSRGVAISYNNIGEIYLAMKEYDSALNNLQASLRIKKENNDRKSFSHTLTNLGTTSLYLQRPREAWDYFKESLTLKKEFKDLVGEIDCYNNLARIALYEKDYLVAEMHLQQAENFLKQSYYPELRRDNLELRIQSSRLANQPVRALEYLTELLVVKDSILNKSKAESMNALQVEYETEAKENQILRLEEQGHIKSAEIRVKQLLIYTLWGGIVLLIVIAVLIFKNLQTVRKAKESYQLLLGELHHRVKNNLQLLASVLSLQTQQLKDENALMAAKSIESRVNAMALIHRKLYLGERNRTINMKEYVQELTDFLLYSYGFKKDELTIRLTVEEMELDVDKAIPLGLILNEVISNALKYAFDDKSDGILSVSVQKIGKELTVGVLDNGRGFDYKETETEGQSFGLKMIRLLSRELKGTLQISADKGTAVHLKIALA